jgi:CubicO group peptidase (beta-lactamase class C family)
MLCNGGQLNGKRILSPWTVDLMMSNKVGELFEGQIGRPPKGVGFGLGGEVVVSGVDARLRRPNGSYGWDGAYGTYWWVNRKVQSTKSIPFKLARHISAPMLRSSARTAPRIPM